MSDSKEFVERRKHERFEVKAGAFAGVLKSTYGYTHIGKIINISEGGLCFQYISKNGGPVGTCKLDLLFRNDIVSLNYVRQVPVETVWISDAGIDPTSSRLKTKAVGVKFKELSLQQREALDVFIQKYTVRQG
jgi:hypothetical protein